MLNEEDIKAIQQAQKYQAGAWARVLETAKKYGMVKLHGVTLQNGEVNHIHFSEVEIYATTLRDQLLSDIERAMLEDALMGATIMERT